MTLVSAYDIHYKKISPPFDFPSLIFFDSGGYEASKEMELSDFGDKEHTPKSWTLQDHEEVIANWRPAVPSVLISYDHPKARVSIKEQIERARKMAPGRDEFVREILLKPEHSNNITLPIEKIIENVRALADFDIIGVTEKEVGTSIFDRMKNIAKLRVSLDKVGLEIPIHVFGSMDTVTTPMYFLAGADIFDGLTWLRFAFHDGYTVYKHNYGALKFGVKTKAHLVDGHCWNDNYRYIQKMEAEMRRYLSERDMGVFEFHGGLFKTALESVEEDIGVDNGR